MDVVVLGMGCSRCDALARATQAAMKELGMDAGKFRRVEGLENIAAYGVVATPALAVNGEVMWAGSVASKDKVVEILRNAKQREEAATRGS